MPMCMTPDSFFTAFVDGNYVDFHTNQESVRHAVNAAVSASHMADHYLKYYCRHDPSKVRGFRERVPGPFIDHLCKLTNGAFRDIRSIANAYKHLYADDDRHSTISSAGTIEFLPIRGPGVQAMTEGEGGVWYMTNAGDQRQFLPVLEVVVEFWRRLLMS